MEFCAKKNSPFSPYWGILSETRFGIRDCMIVRQLLNCCQPNTGPNCKLARVFELAKKEFYDVQLARCHVKCPYPRPPKGGDSFPALSALVNAEMKEHVRILKCQQDMLNVLCAFCLSFIFTGTYTTMLSIRNIVKQYDKHRALDNVSLEIERGKVFGLLGPNGAGKTSLIRIINQITAPDAGEVYFMGEKLNPSHIGRIGYLPEERGLYKKMEIGEQILYLAQLKGLSRDEAKKRARYWFEKLEIQGWWRKKIEELSKGMQQKAQFVATVIHEPELLILDEPFTGFDPVNADIIKNEILELNRKGATIIFSTHRMESVEELCDSIALINLSHKILDGRVRDIRRQYRKGIYVLEYDGDGVHFGDDAPFAIMGTTMLDDRQQLKLKIAEGRTVNEVLAWLLPKVSISRLEEVVPTMNEIFIETVSGGR